MVIDLKTEEKYGCGNFKFPRKRTTEIPSSAMSL